MAGRDSGARGMMLNLGLQGASLMMPGVTQKVWWHKSLSKWRGWDFGSLVYGRKLEGLDEESRVSICEKSWLGA